MAKLTIKSIAGSLLFEGDFSSLAECVSAAVKAKANLSYADLRHADLSYADLSYANLRYADLSSVLKALPDVKNPDAQILAAIEAGGTLDMSTWHRCETTHCRAGWYIQLSGPAGAMLEAVYGPSVAGALIFTKAYPGKKVPDFVASDVDALADIRANAKHGEKAGV